DLVDHGSGPGRRLDPVLYLASNLRHPGPGAARLDEYRRDRTPVLVGVPVPRCSGGDRERAAPARWPDGEPGPQIRRCDPLVLDSRARWQTGCVPRTTCELHLADAEQHRRVSRAVLPALRLFA